MKICLFGDASSVHVQQLALGFAQREHEVHVVTHKPADVPGATVERFHVPDPGLTNLRRWEGRVRNYLRAFLRRFDVVNIHFLNDWGLRFDPPLIERAALVASAWGSDVVDPPGETPASTELAQVRRTLLRRADAVTACGPTFAGVVADFANVGEDHVEVLPFGVDLGRFARRTSTTTSPPYRVGFFKGFRFVYGASVLVEAIPYVLRACPQTRFELVGDGAELDRCRKMAVDLEVERSIDWQGRQEHRAIPRLLNRWDLCVIPSLHEAFGVAALESSAAGVPVVASDVCGLRDTVRQRETGLLVPPGDARALASGIVELLRDAALRQRMAEAGRRMVEQQFDWSELHDRWVAFYRRVRECSAVMV